MPLKVHGTIRHSGVTTLSRDKRRPATVKLEQDRAVNMFVNLCDFSHHTYFGLFIQPPLHQTQCDVSSFYM